MGPVPASAPSKSVTGRPLGRAGSEASGDGVAHLGRVAPELRRRGRAGGLEPRGQRQRLLRHHRPQRGGQDQHLQLHQRHLCADPWAHPLQRPGHHALEAPPSREASNRADLPEHRPLQRDDRFGQPEDRQSHPSALGGPGLRSLLRQGRSRGVRPPRHDRARDHRSARAAGNPPQDRWHPSLWVAKAGGAGPGAGPGSDPAAARRAHRGDERGGDRGHGTLHPLRQAGKAPHGGDDRARHGRRHGYLGSSGRPRFRAEDRRGRSRRGPAGPRGHQGLPGRGFRGGLRVAGMDHGTLPRLLLAQAQRLGRRRVALREKKYGIWQEVTWEQYAAHVRTVCLGLVSLGLNRGDKVAVISGNRPAWLYVELAAQSVGAIPLGIFVDSLPEQVKSILEHSQARFVLVEDQEQADKVLMVRGHVPRLERIIVDDMRGLEGYQDPMLVSLESVEQLGRDLEAREGRLYEEILQRGDPTDVALLAYTSGTTGMSKAAMISHRNLLAMAAGVTQVDPVHETDEIVSFLPFAWVGEQLISVAIALHVGATVNFPEEPETMRDDLREIGPHVMIAPPRFWEAMCSEYQVKIDDAGFVKQAATRAALAIGERVAAWL